MIDVSAYQGLIDWGKVYDAGVRRAYIKLGENGYQDAACDRNVKEARKHGLEVGLYFYGHPSHSPAAEARWFLRAAAPYLADGDLPPALDLEVAEGHDWAFLTGWANSWLQAVDAHTGCLAAFYSYESFWQRMTLDAKRPVWGADLNPAFVPPPSWAFHQYSFTGKVPGIRGHVDFDRMLWNPVRVGGGKP